MENNLNKQKPVEFFSAERIKIEIDGQQILWRDMNLEIDSKIGEHTIDGITEPVKFIRCLDRQKRG